MNKETYDELISSLRLEIKELEKDLKKAGEISQLNKKQSYIG